MSNYWLQVYTPYDDFDAPQETVTFGDQQVEVATASKSASDDFDDEIPF